MVAGSGNEEKIYFGGGTDKSCCHIGCETSGRKISRNTPRLWGMMSQKEGCAHNQIKNTSKEAGDQKSNCMHTKFEMLIRYPSDIHMVLPNRG